MNLKKIYFYVSLVSISFFSISNSYAQPHSHGGRSHNHNLPAQGLGHRHGNSAIGKPSNNTPQKKNTLSNRAPALTTEQQNIYNQVTQASDRYICNQPQSFNSKGAACSSFNLATYTLACSYPVAISNKDVKLMKSLNNIISSSIVNTEKLISGQPSTMNLASRCGLRMGQSTKKIGDNLHLKGIQESIARRSLASQQNIKTKNVKVQKCLSPVGQLRPCTPKQLRAIRESKARDIPGFQ